MLRKQVYTYILKMMLAHPQAIQYYPTDDGVWITDGVIGFYIAEEHQVFDLSKLMVIDGLRSMLELAPSRTYNYLRMIPSASRSPVDISYTSTSGPVRRLGLMTACSASFSRTRSTSIFSQRAKSLFLYIRSTVRT